MIGAARFPDGLERRAAAVELRASGRRLQGYAAVFDAPTRIGGPKGFEERIAAGAFGASLASGADMLALVDHDPTKVLARTAAGNLRLSEDSRGLAFEIDLPRTTLANDTLALVESRTAGGMSFGFRVPKGGDEWRTSDQRILKAVELIEVSVVSAFPAYTQTTVAARSGLLAAIEALEADRAAAMRRLRIRMI